MTSKVYYTFKINESHHSFSNDQSVVKPLDHGLALGSLQQIEKILQGIKANDLHSENFKKPQEAAIQLLTCALQIKKAFIQKADKVFWKWICGIDSKKKQLEATYKNIVQLVALIQSLTYKKLQEDAHDAFQNRDLNKLKELFDNDKENICNFLEKSDIDTFISSSSGAKETDLALLDWLCPYLPKSDLQNLAKRAASDGDEGLLILKTLYISCINNHLDLDNVFAWEDLFTTCIGSSSAQKGQAFYALQWLVEKGNNKLPKDLSKTIIEAALKDTSWKTIELLLAKFEYSDYLSLFQHALSLGTDGIPLLKIIWDKAPPDSKTYKCFADALLEFDCISCIPQHLDFLLEELFLLLGTPFFPNYYGSKLYGRQLRSEITSHFNKKEMACIYDSDPPIVRVDFRNIFNLMSQDGLPFFEEACKKHPNLSSYAVRWAFLKAASNGQKGLPLMEWLAKNAPQKLSYWTMARAIRTLENSGNLETSAKIKTLQAALFKDAEKTSVDNVDMQLELSLSQNPSGYRSLGDIPERAGWKPLTQKELNDFAKGIAIPEEPFPFDASVQIVEDSVATILPHQIRKSEAKLFSDLYSLIKQGKTAIQIDDSNSDFKNEILKQLKKILSRPSGRWLVLFICRHVQRMPIKPSSLIGFLTHTDLANSFIGIDLSKHPMKLMQNEKDLFYCLETLDATLFHELLHALHYHQNYDLSFHLNLSNPLDGRYDTLEEQFTISGVDDDSILAGHFALTENTYNEEWGYYKRYSHKGTFLESFSAKDQEKFKDKNSLLKLEETWYF